MKRSGCYPCSILATQGKDNPDCPMCKGSGIAHRPITLGSGQMGSSASLPNTLPPADVVPRGK